MGIVHVELFEFKPLATQEEVQDVSSLNSFLFRPSSSGPPLPVLPSRSFQESDAKATLNRHARDRKTDCEKRKKKVCDRMMSLKDRCTHPKTHLPYLKTAIGGANVFPEAKVGLVGFLLTLLHLPSFSPSFI